MIVSTIKKETSKEIGKEKKQMQMIKLRISMNQSKSDIHESYTDNKFYAFPCP